MLVVSSVIVSPSSLALTSRITSEITVSTIADTYVPFQCVVVVMIVAVTTIVTGLNVIRTGVLAGAVIRRAE